MSAFATGDPGWSFPHCPAGPPWRVEWAALVDRFAWLRGMAGCPQDPAFHAEGDVLIHVGMVAEALVALPAWQALAAEERSILFAAALLHDVAKPRCTATEPDGRISARGHARIGARMARQILWQDDPAFRASPVPFACREAVAGLVRLHGLPVYLTDDAEPDRAVIRASQRVRCDRLALLAEADVRGRRCPDPDDLLARIDLFRDYAAEWGCLEDPYPFASDHSRFLYFRKAGADPAYAAYDDTRCRATLLSGMPGAGKDHHLRHTLPGLPVISLDALRESLRVDPGEAQGVVIDAAREQAREHLRSGRDFAWNATNLTRQMRARLIDLFADYGARIRIVYLEAPWAEMYRRNADRPRPVPDAVIRRMAASLEVPDRTEAHEVLWLAEGA